MSLGLQVLKCKTYYVYLYMYLVQYCNGRVSHPAALVSIKRGCLNNPLLNTTRKSDVSHDDDDDDEFYRVNNEDLKGWWL